MLTPCPHTRSSLTFILAAGAGLPSFAGGWDNAVSRVVHNHLGQSLELHLAEVPDKCRVGLQRRGNGQSWEPIQRLLPEWDGGDGSEDAVVSPATVQPGEKVRLWFDDPESSHSPAKLNIQDHAPGGMAEVRLSSKLSETGNCAEVFPGSRPGVKVTNGKDGIYITRALATQPSDVQIKQAATQTPAVETKVDHNAVGTPSRAGSQGRASRADSKSGQSPSATLPNLPGVLTAAQGRTSGNVPRENGAGARSRGNSEVESRAGLVPGQLILPDLPRPTGDKPGTAAPDLGAQTEPTLQVVLINQTWDQATVIFRHRQAQVGWVLCKANKKPESDPSQVLLGAQESIVISHPLSALNPAGDTSYLVTDDKGGSQLQFTWEVVKNHLPASGLRLKGGKVDGKALNPVQMQPMVRIEGNYVTLLDWTPGAAIKATPRNDSPGHKYSLLSPAGSPGLSRVPSAIFNLSAHSASSSPTRSPLNPGKPSRSGVNLPPLNLSPNNQ